ncbi:MAG TPA: endolytic transglycosylase MltG [Ignavibacteriaceae bacterium]|nr:endolytic transglycosylase MltG [Ignavibacteriaceae bacterium]
MQDIIRKIENELNNLSLQEREGILNRLRKEVDDLDKEIVPLLCRRTLFSVLIGRIKRSLRMPTYAPEREKEISKKINLYREDPLSSEALQRIYERIIDESRRIQREEAEKGNIFKVSDAKFKVSFINILTKKQLFFVLSFFLALLIVFYFIFFTPNYYEESSPARFQVDRGESLNEVVTSLYERGIIPNRLNMKIAAFLYGAEKKIRAARYKIPNGLNYFELLELFIKGEADFLRPVTIADGSTLRWVAKKLQNEVFIDSLSIIKTSADKNFIDSLGYSSVNINTLEGYILPRTYYIYERSSPNEAMTILSKGLKDFFNDTLLHRLDSIGYSMHELLTVASIVEGETNKVEEMPIIAGVYYNRLRIGMRLQADPTVQYLQINGWKRLKYRDLRTKNPYNTYLFTGLPPGPINNPRKEAILAALYPVKHQYFYFVADGQGGHKFSKTYTEHLRLVKEYRKWLNSVNKF